MGPPFSSATVLRRCVDVADAELDAVAVQPVGQLREHLERLDVEIRVSGEGQDERATLALSVGSRC